MKILLVTGKLAEKEVKKVAERFNCGVYVAPVKIASFLTPQMIANNIDRDYDIIIAPGLLKGDLAMIEKKTGIKTYRGPKDIADLETVLENLGKVKLSKEVPADELITGILKEKAMQEIAKVNSSDYKKKMLKKHGSMLIGELGVGKAFPIRILAEIVDADTKGVSEIINAAKYYIKSGADIIDFGFREPNPNKVKEIINASRTLGVPISIDTMGKENIQSAIESGADLILSLDRELIESFEGVSIPVVIIPRKKGIIPEKPEERIKVLKENLALAKKRGFKKVIADLVLNPLNFGLSNSIVAYKKFGESSSVPILMGAGNVTELLDADSIGVNALLCGIASECGAGILFTTETSDKTRGSVRELVTASKMMYLSKRRGSSVKDLGFDLLMLKEKKIKRDKFKLKVKKIKAATNKSYRMDPNGYFKIYVDENIKCVHFFDKKPTLLIEGKNAKEISDTIFNLNLISDYSHALYMGRELDKAEFALKYGKSYFQS